MKLYAPKYYTEFNCIADKCNHSCCVGWEIDIDSATLDRYKCLSHSYAEKLRSSLSDDETPHFNLTCGDRCPHLNEKGLCEIILNVGEDYLCDICREHPRFYNTSDGCMYVGLGMACEEAARLIISSDAYNEFVEVGEVEGEDDVDFDSASRRAEIYSILSESETAYSERLERIYAIFGESPKLLSDDCWKTVIDSLEYLDETHKTMFSCYSSEICVAPEYEKALERALAYFVYRHCTDIADEYEFSLSLGFCLFCERLLASLLAFGNPKDEYEIARLARILSEELEYSEDNTEAIKLEF